MSEWCSRHDYQFSFRTNNAIKALNSHWNKIGHLLDLFENHPQQISKFQWLMWIDNDTLITRPDSALDLKQYSSSIDIVIAGDLNEFNKDPVDMYKALNTGVIILRNSQGSIKFLREIYRLGLLAVEEREKVQLFLNL